jgi:hypothetical protein
MLPLRGKVLITIANSFRFKLNVADLEKSEYTAHMTRYADSIAESSSTPILPFLIGDVVPCNTAKRSKDGCKGVEVGWGGLPPPKRQKRLSDGDLWS